MKWILITGASGGIGSELVRLFMDTEWGVIASDKKRINEFRTSKEFIKLDLEDIIHDQKSLNEFKNNVSEVTSGSNISAVVNNAALQIVKPFDQLSIDDWQSSIKVNLLAPIILSKLFLKDLVQTNGSIINITSIHNELTKKNFSAYATTKTALAGLTRSLSIELAPAVRVNGIEPAAIDTEMLNSGFEGRDFKKEDLCKFHPTNSIGTPKDIFNAVQFLLNPENSFLNGSIIKVSGGIHNRLYDLN